jgi:prophage DNA circulation protein
MRDWSKAFLPASFKGVRFHVDREGEDGGRRLAIQHVAYGEAAVTEDFGARERVFPVIAYLASDVADAQARILTAALRSPGAGRLVLPMEGGMLAHVEDFRRDRRKDKNGWIAFDIGFVRAGSGVEFAPSFDANGALAAFDVITAAVSTAITLAVR